MNARMATARTSCGSYLTFSVLPKAKIMHVRVLILLSLLGFGSSTIAAAAENSVARLFDKPVETAKVPLVPDPVNSKAQPNVSCSYYRGFMVKQIDLGEVGASQLSIVPVSGAQGPRCVQSNTSSENVIDAKEWSGYFKGVKGDYVFFDADDGVNGGLGFAVYKGPDGKKMFEDVAKSWRTIEIKGMELRLRYVRTYAAGCSIFADAAGCWAKIKQDTGISQSTPPDCSAAYMAEQKRMQGNKDFTAGQIAAIPSVIDYEVETAVDGARHTITPLPGRLACRLAS
jgi:hypothetical protein